MRLDLATFLVREHEEAIRFFVDALGFEVSEDLPSTTTDGRPKRWVVVRPPGGGTGLVLAMADAVEQEGAIGRQTGGWVGFFLRVDDFAAAYERMCEHGVTFLEEPRLEPYGTVAVFSRRVRRDLGPAGTLTTRSPGCSLRLPVLDLGAEPIGRRFLVSAERLLAPDPDRLPSHRRCASRTNRRCSNSRSPDRCRSRRRSA